MKRIIVYLMLIMPVSCIGSQNNEVKMDVNHSIISENPEDTLNVKSSQQPYEATWMKIAKTKNGYVVYNYPSLWNDGETQNPVMIIIKNNQLTNITFSDDVMTYTFDKVEKGDDNSYFFKVGNFYRFKWVDKEKHIAQWTIYYGDDRVMTDYYYVDILYNVYPIVDYIWSENNIEDY